MGLNRPENAKQALHHQAHHQACDPSCPDLNVCFFSLRSRPVFYNLLGSLAVIGTPPMNVLPWTRVLHPFESSWGVGGTGKKYEQVKLT